MTKLRIAAIIILAILAIFITGVVYAAISKQFNHIVTVTGTEALSLWQEEACETPLLDVDWGTVDAGEFQHTVWLRNDGTTTLNITVQHGLLPADLGIGGESEMQLTPGEVYGWVLTLYVGSQATPGTYTWSTTLTASAV